MIDTKVVESGDGGQQLHRRRGTHQLACVALIEQRVVGQVPDHQTYLRVLQQRIGQQRI